MTILDKKLDKISTIENLAKGETIYSARFMGESGYFVTYEQVDPLFSVDLSDPEKPKILGKLKIPDFPNTCISMEKTDCSVSECQPMKNPAWQKE